MNEENMVDEDELLKLEDEPEGDEEIADADHFGEAGGQEEDDEARSPEQIALILRMTEALLFASDEPLDVKTLAGRLPKGADVKTALLDLQGLYKNRGVNLICVGGKWSLRTAPDLSYLMEEEREETRRLSKAAIETLAIIAYHQPVTRAEIEDIRGVAVSKGTLDLLMEANWIRPRGRRRVPGRPLTYGTSDEFLSHFGLESVQALPGLDDLKAAGLLEARLPPGFDVPDPSRNDAEAELDPIDEENDDLSDTLDISGEEEEIEGVDWSGGEAEPVEESDEEDADSDLQAIANDNSEGESEPAEESSADLQAKSALRQGGVLRG